MNPNPLTPSFQQNLVGYFGKLHGISFRHVLKKMLREDRKFNKRSKRKGKQEAITFPLVKKFDAPFLSEVVSDEMLLGVSNLSSTIRLYQYAVSSIPCMSFWCSRTVVTRAAVVRTSRRLCSRFHDNEKYR